MTVQVDLCRTCSETTLLVFPRDGSILEVYTNNMTIVFMLSLQTDIFPPQFADENTTDASPVSQFLSGGGGGGGGGNYLYMT